MNRQPDTEPCGTLFVGRRGFRQRAAASTRRLHVAVYCIEGQHVTLPRMATILGIHEDTARLRLRQAAKGDGPVTWAVLRGEAA